MTTTFSFIFAGSEWLKWLNLIFSVFGMCWMALTAVLSLALWTNVDITYRIGDLLMVTAIVILFICLIYFRGTLISQFSLYFQREDTGQTTLCYIKLHFKNAISL